MSRARRCEDSVAQARPAEAPVSDRVARLDDLVAGRVRVPERVQPYIDPVADMRRDLVDARRTDDEQRGSRDDVGEARCGDVEHREENAEVEEPTAEVVCLYEDEHCAAPDHEQRAEILEPALRDHLPLFAQVAGEEDDQRQLRELARLELERAGADPQPGAVHGRAEAGQGGQHQ